MLTLVCAALLALAAPVTAADRAAVVEAAAMRLEAEYVFPDKGAAMAEILREKLAGGAYRAFADGEAFAEQLSRDLQSVSGDGHLNIQYSEEPIDLDAAEAAGEFSAEEMERWYGAHLNHGLEKAVRLEGNVGLLELSVFPPLDMGAETLIGAMQALAATDALIIDLRENGGGAETARLLISYLFDAPQPLSGYYSRIEDETTQRHSYDYLPGRRYGADKPVYVLISEKTFSAAEAVAYDLQALGRATVIGEPSGGGAHPFDYAPIHEHFVLWLVTGRSVNPITGGNWQGVGVQPDMAAPPGEALDIAHGLALEALEREAASTAD